ncbi:C13 family peptidase [Brevundimonas sp.]|uniref:C13 family peptidase n=1 Tax=Brevundimonas sp. TaxID=1871086 RepID=UPI0025CB9E63|nr:C13 family peptidase [Brevundimonas sp.]
MLRGVLAVALAIIFAGLPPLHAARAQQASFADWAVVVVAADWRSSQGAPIEAFENARRDLSAAFAEAGFAPHNITDLSLRPDAEGRAMAATAAFEAIGRQTSTATGGCLLYFTSHGSPAGIVFGADGTMPPQMMDQLVDRWCGARPTVVVVSACYSGVFVPALAAPNRMIMTAAKRDRSSFGCSEDATHPYFDGCVLEAMDSATDFMALSSLARACVSRREREEGLRPPSEPQTWIGSEMQLLLPFLSFERPA